MWRVVFKVVLPRVVSTVVLLSVLATVLSQGVKAVFLRMLGGVAFPRVLSLVVLSDSEKGGSPKVSGKVVLLTVFGYGGLPRFMGKVVYQRFQTRCLSRGDWVWWYSQHFPRVWVP